MPQLLQVGWIALLGVLSFLINFIVFIFILCFLEAILGLGFLFSILFCCDYALGMKNCFGFEKICGIKITLKLIQQYKTHN